jgi:hypothetical protein
MVPVVFVTLMGMEPLATNLVKVTGVEISPWITGGKVARTISHGRYETRIYEPVFDAMIGQRREGFVQIVWGAAGSLPETIVEAIDYNHDGQADFEVTLHPKTKTADWRALTDQAIGMDGPYAIGDGIGVRIKLKNKPN